MTQSSESKTVLVTGSRDWGRGWDDMRLMTTTLSSLDIALLITGGARGADTMAEQWAHTNEVETSVWPADWDSQGKAAGRIRNRQMLDFLLTQSNPLVLAFKDNFDKRMLKGGTEHMVKISLIAGVPVSIFPDPTGDQMTLDSLWDL